MRQVNDVILQEATLHRKQMWSEVCMEEGGKVAECREEEEMRIKERGDTHTHMGLLGHWTLSLSLSEMMNLWMF